MELLTLEVATEKLLPETVYFYVVDLGDTDIDGNTVSEETRYRKGIVYIRRPNE